MNRWLKQEKWLLAATVAFVGLAVLVVVLVLWPAYRSPSNRTYASGFGYAEVQRQIGKPFEVEVAVAQSRGLSQPILGEGLLASQSVLVPIIPMDFILTVEVAEGDRVQSGQLLATIDNRKALIKKESAELAIRTAQAELDRVLIGSAYVLAQERPEKDRIQLENARRQLELLREEEKAYVKLLSVGAVSRMQLLEVQRQISRFESELAEGEFNLGMSTEGQQRSRQIAANAIAEAEHVLQQRRLELESYRIYAPCDGVVERVLIQPGEYNQDTGRPAFVIAQGLWFEANVDQTALGRVAVGDPAEIRLEAFPHLLAPGRVERVVPVVTYNLGGPETNRPIRPKGSGAPEWPATFAVRVAIDPGLIPQLAPGLTGYAKIHSRQTAVVVPRTALVSPSAGRARLWLLGAAGTNPESREVNYGGDDRGWVAITKGLAEGERVLVEGHHLLQAGDAVVVRANADS
jgi:multidrug efflux pump subunit AcrA (membrane-fusion protein)